MAHKHARPRQPVDLGPALTTFALVIATAAAQTVSLMYRALAG